MARNIDAIQRDIERTRRQLAGTLDQIAERSRPQNLVEDARKTMRDRLKDPRVQLVLGGIAGVVVLGVGLSIRRNRKYHRDLRELQQLLAQR
ncbi:DUF3618 domain-containing protein [Corynebacterium sp.]|uniref:DUF3618 domain-containing protein n=1 Tax=Corynebacterium sp. TaxID=1720 RepID=UPI0026DBD790|nr:DUF3618 domain-containing protein [Corynebacterium sp.]MDO5076196.1 DUF3618 domain-containing protein [Corynebacterium sp.]